MDRIDNIAPLKDPVFIKPILIEYTHKGDQKKWEAVISHDSVAILLFHKEKECFVFVKQLRAPVLNTNKDDGYMYELCAGIVDKKLTLAEIAREEVLEECGYDVPLQNVQKITSFYTSVGISGAKQSMFFAMVDESMKVSEGGGLVEEDIEVIYLSLKDAKALCLMSLTKKHQGL